MSAFSDLCQADAPATRLLLEFNVFHPGQPSGAGIMPFASEPFLALPEGEEFIISEETRRFGDADHLSRPGDSPANKLWRYAQLTPPTITRGLPFGPLGSRRLTFAVGEASLAAVIAALDTDIAAGGIDGRDVLMRLGAPDWPLADFGTIFAGAGVVMWRDGARVRIVLRDNSYKLARSLQTSRYAGTGGAEGGADLANLPRPLNFGQRWNVAAVLIDQANQVWQLHVRSLEAIDAVFEGGAAVTASGSDYPTYSALVAASITPGQYATCLAFGMFRLGREPTGRITAHLHGDNVGGYVETASGIALRILQDFADVGDAEIDLTGMAAFAAAEPAAIGWGRGTEAINIDAALEEVAAQVLGWWGCRRNGLYIMGALRGPSEADNDYAWSEAAGDILDITALDPSDSGNYPPPWRIGAGYMPVSVVQTGDGLLGGATEAHKQLVSQAFRYAVAADPGIPGRYRQAQDWSQLPAGYADANAARARAAAMLAAYGPGQQLFRVTLPARRTYRRDLGEGGPITAPRFGINNRPSRILRLPENPAANTTTATVWIKP